MILWAITSDLTNFIQSNSAVQQEEEEKSMGNEGAGDFCPILVV